MEAVRLDRGHDRKRLVDLPSEDLTEQDQARFEQIVSTRLSPDQCARIAEPPQVHRSSATCWPWS